MAYTQPQLTTLRSLLDADPARFGALSDQDAATEMNALTEVRIRASMTGAEVSRNIDATEYGALSTADKGTILSLCALDDLDPANGGLMVQTISDVLPGGATQANLVAARDETVSLATLNGLPACKGDYVRIARSL